MSYPADPWQDRDPAAQPPPPPHSPAPQAPPASGPPSSGMPTPVTPYYPPVPQPPAPVTYPPVGAHVSYGYDPVTGMPLSDKSKIVAGLLQLLLGFLFTLGGVGRLYAGHTTIGVVQLALSLVGWSMFWCGLFLNVFALFIPLLAWFGIWAWFVIDGIVILAGRPVDGQGRLLRT